MADALGVDIAVSHRLLAGIVSLALQEAGHTVVNVAGSVADLLACQNHAEVAVVDVTLAGGDLVAAIPALLARGQRALVISSADGAAHGMRLLLAGASGLVTVEEASLSDIANAVTAVAAGTSALHPDVAMALLQQWRSSRSELRHPPLSARESDVLKQLAAGLSNREIGTRLGISEKTVETHKSRVYQKLGAKNQAHAVSVATERGLLPRG